MRGSLRYRQELNVGQQYDASFPRRRWRKLLLIPMFFGICGAVFVGWAIYHGGQELRDATAEAAKDDPNWQLADIEANRRQVADIDIVLHHRGGETTLRPTGQRNTA